MALRAILIIKAASPRDAYRTRLHSVVLRANHVKVQGRPIWERFTGATSRFLRANPDDIARAWENFARTLTPFAAELSDSILRDHLPEILIAIADDMETAQSSEEQQTKSKGHGPKGGALDQISAVHAHARLASGFSLEHAIAEYRALRSSILFLWVRSAPRPDDIRLAEVTRFNETVDQAIAELVRRYAHSDEALNNRFVGVLSHELRTPISVIGLLAGVLDKSLTEPSQHDNVARIQRNVANISRMVDDLAIVVRSRTEVGLPLTTQAADLGVITEETLQQIKLLHPSAIFTIEKSGDLTGTWDKSRLQQMVFNLAANAVRHSSDQRAKIVLRGAATDVLMTIVNRGAPIPADQQPFIFEPFVQKDRTAPSHPSSGLGLGLFVVREIVDAHKGSVEVTSTELDGTTFNVRLPRLSSAG